MIEETQSLRYYSHEPHLMFLEWVEALYQTLLLKCSSKNETIVIKYYVMFFLGMFPTSFLVEFCCLTYVTQHKREIHITLNTKRDLLNVILLKLNNSKQNQWRQII